MSLVLSIILSIFAQGASGPIGVPAEPKSAGGVSCAPAGNNNWNCMACSGYGEEQTCSSWAESWGNRRHVRC